MSKRPFIAFGVLAAVCLILIPYFALGKEGESDAGTSRVASADVASKDLFETKCGYCHTLAAAGTDGVVGPNLDDTLVPTGINAPEQFEGIYSRVLQAVECGKAGRMPKGILEGDEAQQVAAFSAAYAGQIGDGPTVDLAETPLPDASFDCPE